MMEEDYLLDSDLLIAIRRDIARHLDKFEKFRDVLIEVKQLRDKLEIKKLGADHLDTYAVDSSHTQPIELIGGVFSLVTYGYVGISGGVRDRFMSGSIYFDDGDESGISKHAAQLEKKLATKLLKAKKLGTKNFDLLLLDGEITIRPLFFASEKRYGEVNQVVDQMLKWAYMSKTTVASIAKRVRSRYLSTVAGRWLDVNDKIAASLILQPGEYFSLGKLRQLLPAWALAYYTRDVDRELVLKCHRDGEQPADDTTKLRCGKLRKFERDFTEFLNSSKYLKLLGEVEVVFYKPPGHRSAVRVEVLDLGELGVERVVSHLASSTSSVTGLPQILDAVDQYVRASPELAEQLLTMLMSKTASDFTLFMWPTNPQKRLLGRY